MPVSAAIETVIAAAVAAAEELEDVVSMQIQQIAKPASLIKYAEPLSILSVLIIIAKLKRDMKNTYRKSKLVVLGQVDQVGFAHRPAVKNLREAKILLR